MDLDIVIYAVIAVLVLARLWAVLGRRNEEDRERPNPFVVPPGQPHADGDEKFSPSAQREIPVLRPLLSAPASLAGGLEQIKILDPTFDEKQFLLGARAAFSMILEDFAKGDLARSTPFLEPKVLKNFQAAIDARRQVGHSMDNKLIKVRDADADAASVDGSSCFITVRFVSEQENVLRDANGKVIGGTEGLTEEITDQWTFTRDTKLDDPNWHLFETRS